jgi:hypothetical protein
MNEAVDTISVETRDLYSSRNGDRWLLCRNTENKRVFVRHEPNAHSGGQVSDLDIGVFLRGGPLNPEHQALLRLIATSGELRRVDRRRSGGTWHAGIVAFLFNDLVGARQQ